MRVGTRWPPGRGGIENDSKVSGLGKWKAAGATSLHVEYWRLRKGSNELALEGEHLGEVIQESVRYMGCLDPECLGRRHVWKLHCGSGRDGPW